jgi:hypothetical protein
MTVATILTILAGLRMFWIVSKGFDGEFFSTHYGMALSAGALTGISAFLVGFTVNRPAATHLEKIGQEVAQAGGQPTPAQTEEIQRMFGKLGMGAKVIAWLLGITAVLMSLAKYV